VSDDTVFLYETLMSNNRVGAARRGRERRQCAELMDGDQRALRRQRMAAGISPGQADRAGEDGGQGFQG
jgi:hypothetical protein